MKQNFYGNYVSQIMYYNYEVYNNSDWTALNSQSSGSSKF